MAAKKAIKPDSLPPHDPEAEQALLGCVLTDPLKVMGACVMKVKVGAAIFFDVRNKIIYSAMLRLFMDGRHIDVITLRDEIGKAENRTIDGEFMGYIAALPDKTPSAFMFEEYLDILLKKFTLRTIMQVCYEASTASASEKGEVDLILDRFEADALAVRGMNISNRGFADIYQIQKELIAEYNEAADKSRPAGIHTGFKDLDELGGGLRGQEMVVLAGEQSTGKTSLLLNMLYNIARDGTCTGFISLETSSKVLVHRLACLAGQVDGSLAMRGNADDKVAVRMAEGFSRLMTIRKNMLLWDDTVTATQLPALCRSMYQHGARVIGLDYLQLVAGDDDREKSYDRITRTSRTVKNIAKELNIPIFLISALNREITKEDKDSKRRRPRIGDLRGSGQIDYDADRVWLLSLKDQKEINNPIRDVILDQAKQKNGATGTCNLVFYASQFRMESEEQEQVPAEQRELIDSEGPPLSHYDNYHNGNGK